jgi:transposase InsO family protein
MADRSSRPHHCPGQTPASVEQHILDLRQTKQWGPHRIAWTVGMHPSTVHRVLQRHHQPLLGQLDRATGEPVRAPAPVRYEMTVPGELVHVDIKKLGRIPDGGGHRVIGRQAGRRASGTRGRGYAYLHHAIDSYSRVVYSEILDDERKETAAGFWKRANTFFASIGVTVTGVMTDNGSCYRSRVFATALGSDVRHRFTRPYRPQTNGKVERFNRTLVQEWAYATAYASDEARSSTYQDWIHWYNHHRHHTGIGGLTPAQRVHNLTGYYS